ncbi:Non-reducing end beta-L-arabinofuranosidase [Botrytis cinerea]
MAYPQNSYLQTTFTTPGFISRRREVVYSTTLLYQLKVLKTTGRYDAFKLKWHASYHDEPDVWPVPNHLFWDSDVAKWIEGACYFLQYKENQEIDTAVKEYNAGHLIEAALAHNQCYGNNLLLEPILKYIDLLSLTFGPNPEQKHGYPGHPEIELALLRLYEKTRDPKHLDFARYFIDERGNPKGQAGRHYYDVEAEMRGDRPDEMPKYFPEKQSYWYQQAHKPLVEQETIEGHAVRAMYLLTAVSDLVRVDNSEDTEAKRTAVERLWNNMVQKKMYLTGGIGAIKQWEGVMMLAERLLQLDLDGKYADIMELCFYNAVSTGMSEDGSKFTYVNQLASSDTDLSRRAEWFTCACCPPNVARLLGYIGGYLWTSSSDEKNNTVEVNVHTYASAVLSIPVGEYTVQLEQKTDWPWDGNIQFELKSPEAISTTVRLRIPGWAEEWTISPEFERYGSKVTKGYLTLSPDYLRTNPSFQLNITLKPRCISPHPYTNQNIVALARGPILYCAEDFDNPWVDDHFKARKSFTSFHSLVLDTECEITETDVNSAEPYKELTVRDGATLFKIPQQSGPYLAHNEDNFVKVDIRRLHFIPYALRDNRGGKGHMRVGMRRKTTRV